MSEERVNELLADLDRVLAVEPTPALAARVRARIEREPVANWFGQNWHLVAAGVAVLVVGAYVVTRRSSEVRPPESAAVARAAAQPVIQAEPPASPQMSAPTVRVPQGRRARVVTVESTAVAQREPEVVVSPRRRIAVAQLIAAVRDGRVTADSFLTDDKSERPDPFVVAPLVIEPFKIDTVLLNRGGEGTVVR